MGPPRQLSFAFLACLAIKQATAIPGESQLYKAEEGKGVAGRYIVRFDDDVPVDIYSSSQDLSQMEESGALKVLAGINGVAMELSESELSVMRNDDTVSWIEEVQTVRVSLSWALDRIDQTNLPLNKIYQPTATNQGEGVDVYIVDTGIDVYHPQLSGHVGNFWSAFKTFKDDYGHGTHVAGLVASRDYGVAPGASLWSVKVLDATGNGDSTLVVRGLTQVLTHRNRTRASIVNMSLGAGQSPSVNDAVARLVADNVTVIVAAGNSGVNACTVSPASATDAIAVGATDRYDTMASYSNYGECVDIYAPGTNILSTWKDCGYAVNSGTSMASPIVSGAAALFLSSYPKAVPAAVRRLLLESASNGTINLLDPTSPNTFINTRWDPALAAAVSNWVPPSNQLPIASSGGKSSAAVAPIAQVCVKCVGVLGRFDGVCGKDNQCAMRGLCKCAEHGRR
eukprot:comp21181_c0_seq1/m.28722 comp21181_c0_seq1/g.28722  ORF comp21181_c0_seq1/g.28722 comp21181_c0_seq1/m.28722 type:complete len:454 (-) comp21181_c0_seq1:362-1723(-)